MMRPTWSRGRTVVLSPEAIPINDEGEVKLGIREDWEQFSLLVVVNAFVGSMVGMERVVLPLLAEHDFGLVSRAAILSFIVSFGLTKAFANLTSPKCATSASPSNAIGWLACAGRTSTSGPRARR